MSREAIIGAFRYSSKEAQNAYIDGFIRGAKSVSNNKGVIKMNREVQPGHGFWIMSDYSYRKRRQVCHCSVCGLASPRPIGEFCRWCGAHMDQEILDLSRANASEIHAEAIIKE